MIAREQAASTACLAGQLACAVDALRRDGIGLDVRRALVAVEHVVGGDVDQRNAGRLAQPRQLRRAVAVGAVRRVRIMSPPHRRRYRRRRSPPATARRCMEHGGDAVRPVEIERGTADAHGTWRRAAAALRPGAAASLAGAAGRQDWPVAAGDRASILVRLRTRARAVAPGAAGLVLVRQERLVRRQSARAPPAPGRSRSRRAPPPGPRGR